MQQMRIAQSVLPSSEETQNTAAPLNFAALLEQALEQPGTINRASFTFHHYSLGNQLLALMQCAERGLQPGPLATFPGWKEKGRHVRKGEKALTLCMPVTCKRQQADAADDDGEPETFTRFIYRPRWFVLAQTDGTAYDPEPLPTWDKALALSVLDIVEEPFTLTDGNTFGYANGCGLRRHRRAPLLGLRRSGCLLRPDSIVPYVVVPETG